MKITKSELKNFINKEAKKLHKINLLETRKKEISNQLKLLKEDVENWRTETPQKIAKFSRAGDWNDIYEDEKGVEYADVDGVLYYMTPDWEEPLYPAKNVIKDTSNNELNETNGNLRAVKVTFSDGDTITTDMAAGLSDEDIYNYYKIGKTFNIGNVEDNLQKVTNVEILK